MVHELKNFDWSLIIDYHSFPDIPLNCSQIKDDFRPDINNGTDSFHTPKELLEFTNNFFLSKGFEVGIDRPYSGSIVLLKYYQKEKSVMSIMIEINRKLYLKENTNIKTDNFNNIKSYLQKYICKLEKIELT